MDSLSFILDTFEPLADKALLDIGCGGGFLVRALVLRGARATGIDPSAEAIAAASATVQDAVFRVAAAEKLPLEGGSFDGAIFLNSLHHISGMDGALREASRILRGDGRIVVVEPLTSGTFFSALQPIEDETAVRRAAQEAIEATVSRGLLRLLRTEEFIRREAFDSLEHFLERVSAADRSREAVIRDAKESIQAAFEAAAARDAEGRYILDQPLRAQVLAPP